MKALGWLWSFGLTLLVLHVAHDDTVQLLPRRGAVDYSVVEKMKRVCDALLKGQPINGSDTDNMRVFNATLGFPGEGPNSTSSASSKRKAPGNAAPCNTVQNAQHRVMQKNVSIGKVQSNGGGPNFRLSAYDHAAFNVTKVTTGFNIHCLLTSRDYIVPESRINKALTAFDPSNIDKCVSSLQASEMCTCAKHLPRCVSKFTQQQIVDARKAYFGCAGENGATTYLCDALKPSNRDAILKTQGARPELTFSLAGTTVCRTYFGKVFNISNNKLAKVRHLLLNGSNASLNANKHRIPDKSVNEIYNICVAFWFDFFGKCQSPRDGVRLFPVNISQKEVYNRFFVPWLPKAGWQGPVPAFSTFKGARWARQFHDVQNRAKHQHNRCPTCETLSLRLLQGWSNSTEEAAYVADMQCHDVVVREWREMEKSLQMRARHSPRKYIVLSYDDTSKLGLPRLTNRSPKGMTHVRFNVVPFNITNHSTGQDAYIYTVKDRFPKGANRLCTTLYHFIRKIKWGEHECREARHLTLIGDNFGENKNNDVFAFACELVERGWFDTVELLFGPVGHTHNGNDAVHYIHNQLAGNYYSGTLMHYVQRFQQAWASERTRPTAAVLDAQYDWKALYAPLVDRLGGFTKTKHDPKIACAFQIQRAQTGSVEIRWKTNAADSQWLGMEGSSSGPGFITLTGKPTAAPSVIPPVTNIMSIQDYQTLTGANMMGHMVAADIGDAMEWIKEAAKHGDMPVVGLAPVANGEESEYVEDRAKLGAPYIMGVGNHVGTMEVVRPTGFKTLVDFWKLPESLIAVYAAIDDSVALIAARARQTPAVGYARVPMRKRPSYHSAPVDEAKGEADGSDEEEAQEEQDDQEDQDNQADQDDREQVAQVQWGAPWDECQVGKMAVVRTDWDNGSGVELYKVII